MLLELRTKTYDLTPKTQVQIIRCHIVAVSLIRVHNSIATNRQSNRRFTSHANGAISSRLVERYELFLRATHILVSFHEQPS